MQASLTAAGSPTSGTGASARGGLLAALAIAVGGLAFLSSTSTSGPLAGAVAPLAQAGFWGAVLLVSARIGAWIVGSRARGLPHLAWDGTVGLSVLIAAWLVIGLLPGGFRPVTIFAVFGSLVVTALFRAWRDPVARFGAGAPPAAASTWVLALLGAIIAFGLIWNRVPVVFFDTMAYHYAQPELWLLNGRIAPEPWSLHSWFPPGMSVLYGVGLALGGESWAGGANLLVGVLSVLLVYDTARRLWGVAAGLVAAALLPAWPQIAYALAIPGSDLAHGVFAAACLASLYLYRVEGDAEWLRRASWIAAGAVLTKYLGFLVPLAIGAGWIFFLVRPRPGTSARMSTRLATSIRFLAPALLLVAPWLASNMAAVGNPVAPVLSGTLATSGLADGGAAMFRQDARGGLPGPADVRRLGPRLFSGDERESRVYPNPAWGWTAVALVPVLFLALRDDRRVRVLLALAAGSFVLWFFTFRWERFLVGTTLLLVVAAAGSCLVAWRRGGVARGLPLVAGLVGVLTLVQAGQEIARFSGGLPVALGRESAADFVERSFPITTLYRQAGNRLDPASTRVLLLGEMRHFRLPLRRAAPTGFNAHPLAESLADSPDVSGANRALRRLGYTHLIVDAGWVERSARSYPSLALFRERPDLLRSYLRSLGPPLALQGGVAIFEIPG